MGPIIAAGVLKAGSTYLSAIQQYNAGKYNARLLNQQADQLEEEAAYNEMLLRRQHTRMQGQNEAAIGKSGLTADSFTDVRHDSDLEFERDMLSQKYQTRQKAANLRSQARRTKQAARWNKDLGVMQAVMGVFDTYAKTTGGV